MKLKHNPKHQFLVVVLSLVFVILISSKNVWLTALANPIQLEGEVFSLAFSPDQSLLVVSERNLSNTKSKTIPLYTARTAVYDVASAKRLYWTSHEREGGDIHFSPDGSSFLFVTTGQNWIKQYDTKTGRLLRRLITRSSISSAGFLNRGRQIIAVSSPTVVWDAKTGKSLRTIATPDVGIFGGVLSGDRKILAITDDGNYRVPGRKCQIWDVGTGRKKWEKILRNAGFPQLSRDGRTVAFETSAGDETNPKSTIHIFDTNSGQKRDAIQRKTRSGYWGISFSPDGRYLLCNGKSGLSDDETELQLFDLSTHKPLWSKQIPQPHDYSFISRDGKSAVAATRGRSLKEKGEINYWDLKSGRLLGTITNLNHQSPILYQTADSKTVAIVKNTQIYIQPVSSLW